MKIYEVKTFIKVKAESKENAISKVWELLHPNIDATIEQANEVVKNE